MVTNRRGVRPRRTVVLINRVEDRSPGRVAFVVHRSRTASRDRSLVALAALQRWVEQRNLAMTGDPNDGAQRPEGADPFAAEENTSQEDRSDESTDSTGPAETPDDSWTKGRLYEKARELEIDGRSKMDKAALLSAVREAVEQRPS